MSLAVTKESALPLLYLFLLFTFLLNISPNRWSISQPLHVPSKTNRKGGKYSFLHQMATETFFIEPSKQFTVSGDHDLCNVSKRVSRGVCSSHSVSLKDRVKSLNSLPDFNHKKIYFFFSFNCLSNLDVPDI